MKIKLKTNIWYQDKRYIADKMMNLFSLNLVVLLTLMIWSNLLTIILGIFMALVTILMVISYRRYQWDNKVVIEKPGEKSK